MKKSAIQHYLASLMNDLTFVLVTGENLAAGADAQNNAALVCLCATPALVGSHQERVSLETERSTNNGRLRNQSAVLTHHNLTKSNSAVDDWEEQRIMGGKERVRGETEGELLSGRNQDARDPG